MMHRQSGARHRTGGYVAAAIFLMAAYSMLIGDAGAAAALAAAGIVLSALQLRRW